MIPSLSNIVEEYLSDPPPSIPKLTRAMLWFTVGAMVLGALAAVLGHAENSFLMIFAGVLIAVIGPIFGVPIAFFSYYYRPTATTVAAARDMILAGHYSSVEAVTTTTTVNGIALARGTVIVVEPVYGKSVRFAVIEEDAPVVTSVLRAAMKRGAEASWI